MPACCVVNCNHRPDRDIQYQYYTFPGKSYEGDRRRKWIAAVRRRMPNGDPWEPRSYSRICSAHFVGGKKSFEMNHPAYVPTIFPTRSTPRQQSLAKKKARKKSLSKRSAKSKNVQTTPNKGSLSCEDAEGIADDDDLNKSTQTEKIEQLGTKGTLTKIKTETSHVDSPQQSSQVEGKVFSEVDVKNCCFRGYKSIADEQQMIDMTGVTVHVFALLISQLPAPRVKDRFSSKDQLLLCLMKLKLGMDSMLGVLFGCKSRSVSKEFRDALHKIYRKTLCWIYWPDKDCITKSMPEVFKIRHPNCRVLIDCLEFKIEQPTTEESKVYCYSRQSGMYTLKVLLGFTPSGYICFVSKCYGGLSSDTAIVMDSGILEKLKPGDEVMLLKEFPGLSTKLDYRITVTSSYLGGNSNEGCDITNMYVEYAIQYLKTYSILKKIPICLMGEINKIMHFLAVLTNLNTRR